MNDAQSENQVILGKNAVLAFLEEHVRQQEKKNAGGALNSGIKINKIFIAQGMRNDARISEIMRLAKLHNIPLSLADRRVLDKLVGPDDRHQGVIAQMSEAEMLDLSGFLNHLRQEDKQSGQTKMRLIAVLDGIEDPHNLGAVIRVAECAGASAVLLPARRSAGVTASVAKTSAGAVATLPVVRIGNIVNALTDLKKFGFWIAGLDAAGSQIYTQADLCVSLAVVIGSEGRGLSRLVSDHCDFLLRIPMFGKTNSLNASVAAGIVFFEINRQRTFKGAEAKAEKQTLT